MSGRPWISCTDEYDIDEPTGTLVEETLKIRTPVSAPQKAVS